MGFYTPYIALRLHAQTTTSMMAASLVALLGLGEGVRHSLAETGPRLWCDPTDMLDQNQSPAASQAASEAAHAVGFKATL